MTTGTVGGASGGRDGCGGNGTARCVAVTETVGVSRGTGGTGGAAWLFGGLVGVEGAGSIGEVTAAGGRVGMAVVARLGAGRRPVGEMVRALKPLGTTGPVVSALLGTWAGGAFAAGAGVAAGGIAGGDAGMRIGGIGTDDGRGGGAIVFGGAGVGAGCSRGTNSSVGAT